MANSQNNIDKIIADVCTIAKIGTIDSLPTWPVSGDVGEHGYLVTPASHEDLAFLAHVAPAARAPVLVNHGRGAMQKAQAALKAFDKKNANATDEQRMAVAQKAFAEAFNGSAETSYQDGNAMQTEANRIIIDSQVKPWLAGQGKPTDNADVLEAARASLEKSMGDGYREMNEWALAKVAAARTYVVQRKGTEVTKVDVSGFKFNAG